MQALNTWIRIIFILPYFRRYFNLPAKIYFSIVRIDRREREWYNKERMTAGGRLSEAERLRR